MNIKINMDIIATIKCYLAVNVLIALTSILFFVFCAFGRKFKQKISFGHLLTLIYALISLSVVLPLALIHQSKSNVWAPQAQVWTAFTAKKVIPSGRGSSAQAALSIGTLMTPMETDVLTLGLLALLSVGIILVGCKLVRDSQKLANIIKGSVPIKKIGTVAILASDLPIIPFAAWIPFRSFVVVPQSILANAPRYHLIVRHEIQHHRQFDTKWIYILQLLKAVCFWNPFVFFLQRQISEIQEVACDEALTGHQGFSSSAYCDCLLWVAQNSLQSRAQLVGTAGFARGSAAKLLKWRVEEMLSVKANSVSGLAVVCLGIVASGFLAVATAATHSSIQDRRITMHDAEAMMRGMNPDQDEQFPVVVNDLVLDQLNKFLGTPDGRKFMKNSLAEMKNHESEVKLYLDQYHLPYELLAVPVIESGYQNIPQDEHVNHGAGIWMFIAKTARSFGLRVNDNVDDRLNIRLETDAAMRMLSALHLQYRDWNLALLAYNCGAGMVDKGIRDTGSRDVWELIRHGYQNDPNYVASVIAAILIMRNPSYLD